MFKVYEDRCREHGWEVSYKTFQDDDKYICTTLAKTSPRGLRFEYNAMTLQSRQGAPLGTPVPSLNDNLHRWIKSNCGLTRSQMEEEQKFMYGELDELKRDLSRGHHFSHLSSWAQ